MKILLLSLFLFGCASVEPVPYCPLPPLPKKATLIYDMNDRGIIETDEGGMFILRNWDAVRKQNGAR